MIVYVGANIVLNLWRKETDPKTGRELWRSSGKLLEEIEVEEFTGIMGITTVMEILHAVRVYTKNKNQEVKKAIKSLRRYGIKFIIPTEVIMADAFVYFMEGHFVPYDAVAVSGCYYCICFIECNQYCILINHASSFNLTSPAAIGRAKSFPS